MPSKIPSHWGKDNGDPSPGCEFVPFATWAFGPIPSGRLLGKCDSTKPMPMYVQRPAVSEESIIKFNVCSSHRGLAVETQAQEDGNYRVVV